MKAMFISLEYTVKGVSYLLAALLVVVVDCWTPEWIPNNLDHGHLEYYFFLTAGLMVLALIAFIPYARHYEFRSEGQSEFTALAADESDIDSSDGDYVY